MLGEYLAAHIFQFLVVFARLGAGIMGMPGVGDPQVQTRTRLFFALAITLIVLPLVEDKLPGQPDSVVALVLILAGEVVIGLFFAAFLRMLLTAMDVCGKIISHMATLNAARSFNPGFGSQGSLVGAFLTTFGTLLLFAANEHHDMLRALVASYAMFEPGSMPMLGDMADTLARTLTRAFSLGFQLAAPVVVTGYILFGLMGILARLMPQMPVFFVMIPIKFMGSMFILMVTLGALGFWFLQVFDERLQMFMNNGTVPL